MTRAALLGGAGAPVMPNARPVVYTTPFTSKLTANTQLTKQTISGLSNNGTIATNTTAPDPGQASWVRLAAFGGSGTQWFLNQITTSATIDLSGGKYWRYHMRQNLNSGTTRFIYWRFATSKTAHDAGNYVQMPVAAQPTAAVSAANWLPDATWVWDGVDPVNDGTVVGTGVASWASVGYVAVQIWQSVAGSTIDLAEVQVVTKASAKAKCLFWHDDLVLGGAQGMQSKLNPYGWKFSEAAMWGKAGITLAMTQSDMNTFAAAGNVFATHAITDAEHVAQTPGQLQNQAIRTKAIARSYNVTGASIADFTWWGGQAYTQVYLDVIRQYYRSGRGNTSNITMPEMIPPAEPHLFKSILTSTADTYAGLWKPAVDRAIATKGLVSFVFHQNLASDAGAGSDGYKAEMDLLLAYLDTNRASIDVVTITDLMALCT